MAKHKVTLEGSDLAPTETCVTCHSVNTPFRLNGIPTCSGCINKKSVTSFQLALEIQQIIDSVELRYMAADGPVTPTNQEITVAELKRIYTNALKIKALEASRGGKQ